MWEGQREDNESHRKFLSYELEAAFPQKYGKKILNLASQHGWLSHSMTGHMSPGPYLMFLSQGTGFGRDCVIYFLVTMYKLNW